MSMRWRHIHDRKVRHSGETMEPTYSISNGKHNNRYEKLVAILVLGLAVAQVWAQQEGKKLQQPQLQAAAVSAPNDPADPVRTASGKAADDSFVIGADDVLAINVWKEPDISRSVPVRSDGKITLPLVGELQAGGETPRQLQQEIATKLQNYISEPEVTVMVQEVRSQRFNVLGQVTKPGSYLISNSATVLDAIAIAGGFRDFAKKKSIYVLRPTAGGGQTRLSFNYASVIKGKNPDQNIELKPHDTVVVP
jgi:polysaccharide biosynthesis/export protein